MTVNNELEMTKKGTPVAYFKIFSQHTPKRTTHNSYNSIMQTNKMRLC